MSEVWESAHPLTVAREKMAVRVASGRTGYVEILQRARQDVLDALGGGDPDDPRTREALSQIHGDLEQALTDHAHRQRRWPSRIDGDRLTRAFRALDESGIMAREEFFCCEPCARDELDNELLLRNSPGSPDAPVRGYAFYHRRDAARAFAEGTLTVRFGASHPIRLAAVGEEVAEALRAHGLTVDWDGDPDGDLRVRMDWKRRRLGRGAAVPGPAADGEPMVHAAFRHPGFFELPEWMTRYQGSVSVRELSRMVLPWLPAVCTAVLSIGLGRTIVVERDFDLLRVEGKPALPREHVEEPLSRWVVGGVWPEEEARSAGTGLLDVHYADFAEQGFESLDYPCAMETAEARHLVYQLTPNNGTFAAFRAPGDEVIQMLWEHGPRLWMESPSVAEGVSRGRHVTLAEAEEMVRVLADEGRVALADLGGLRVVRW
ncbi:DUF6891 domain-containing protein [Nocardiopsis halotolerans]|uniref:DUF6891 domain-containing protein n=1 Tax=Nocardiopsis halotolerans TaxID=124252 RepID=UPI000346BF26|nr:hypothetical protein [Nocardiopsis halotolerans]